MRDLRSFVFLGMLLAVIPGCGEDLHPAYIAAVALPDSITGQRPMTVTVYTLTGDCTVSTGSARFVAVNDSTFELRVEQTSGTPGVGCPGGFLADQFVLANPPSRRFHVRFVGSNTIETTVQSGTPPATSVRERFQFLGLTPTHLDSTSVVLFGCDITDTGYRLCQDTLSVIPVDQNGIAVFESSCDLEGVPYRAYTPDLDRGIELDGSFHCGVPWQTIVQFRN